MINVRLKHARRRVRYLFLSAVRQASRNRAEFDLLNERLKKTAEIYCGFVFAIDASKRSDETRRDGTTCRRLGPWEKSSYTRWMTTAHKEIATEWRKAGGRTGERASERINEWASKTSLHPPSLPQRKYTITFRFLVTRHWCAVTTALYRPARAANHEVGRPTREVNWTAN